MTRHHFNRINLVMLLLILLVACTPVATEAPPEVTEGSIEETEAIPELTQPPTEDATTPVRVPIIPTDEQIGQLLEVFKEAEVPTTGHIPPPPPQVDILEIICQNLFNEGRLMNPDCAFNPERATTYALPDQGTLYQVVSLVPPQDDLQPIDDLLTASSNWEGRGLIVGGLLVYQSDPLRDLSLPIGAYVVFLLRDGDNLFFELYNEPGEILASGSWQLRLLDGKVLEPYTFVTSDQICFSQRIMQACLSVFSRGVGEEANRGLAEQATNNLIDVGLLPASATVNINGALASVDGPSRIELCQNALLETVPDQCMPDIVAAGADPMETNRSASPAIQATDQISQTLEGIGVTEVLAPLERYAFAPTGLITLEVGSYRVDLIQLVDNTWLAQYVSASDGSTFYDLAQLVPGEGELVNPDTLKSIPEPDVVSGVALDRILWSFCTSLSRYRRCSSGTTWIRYYCLTNGRYGWCDFIGYYP